MVSSEGSQPINDEPLYAERRTEPTEGHLRDDERRPDERPPSRTRRGDRAREDGLRPGPPDVHRRPRRSKGRHRVRGPQPDRHADPDRALHRGHARAGAGSDCRRRERPSRPGAACRGRSACRSSAASAAGFASAAPTSPRSSATRRARAVSSASARSRKPIDFFDYYCDRMEQTDGFVNLMGMPGSREESRSVLRPYGVFGIIAPFNFPRRPRRRADRGGAPCRQHRRLQAGRGHAASPASASTRSSRSTLPPGVFNLVTGPRRAGWTGDLATTPASTASCSPARWKSA